MDMVESGTNNVEVGKRKHASKVKAAQELSAAKSTFLIKHLEQSINLKKI
jgi:hypothetical protein